MEAAVDNCPERMDVVDAEAAESIPSEVGMALEAVLALGAVVAAVLRRFFWRSKKKKQKQEAAGEC